jgi:hypothetical protein
VNEEELWWNLELLHHGGLRVHFHTEIPDRDLIICPGDGKD